MGWGKPKGKGKGKPSGKGEGKLGAGKGGKSDVPTLSGNDEAERKRLKLFVGGLPFGVPKEPVEDYFSRYGHVVNVWLSPTSVPDQHAFVTFRNAQDADCAAIDSHKDFPHSRGPLNVHLVGGTPTDESTLKSGDYNPYKVFAAPIPDEIITNNEAIGDFFSQWGLVAMVQKGAKGYCFILYVCNDGALRILNEPSVVFHGKQLDVKPATIKNLDVDFTPMAANWALKDRAIKRHFHKQQAAAKKAADSEAYGEGYGDQW